MFRENALVSKSAYMVHCKYIQCNFYTFYMCPTFHCNLTVLFTFHYCSKYSGINVKLAELQFFYCNFYIGLYSRVRNKRKPTFLNFWNFFQGLCLFKGVRLFRTLEYIEITVETGHM